MLNFIVNKFQIIVFEQLSIPLFKLHSHQSKIVSHWKPFRCSAAKLLFGNTCSFSQLKVLLPFWPSNLPTTITWTNNCDGF